MRSLTAILAAFSVLGLTLADVTGLPVKLVFNGSASAPLGFYWIDDLPARTGEFVLVPVPEVVRDLAVSRGYMPRGVPLIKRVTAAAGDRVCREAGVVSINDVPAAIANSADEKGRALPVWQGCFVLKGHEIFILNAHPRSFDSRYFGVVTRPEIIGRARLLR